MPQFVNDAIEAKKWAFACDYLRLYALSNVGGLYLDSDVYMIESPDKFLNNRFFSAVEHLPEFGEYKFQAAIMGSEPGHPFVKDLMEVYERTSFLNSEAKKKGGEIAPLIYARKADEYGFVRENKEQQLREGVRIYRSEIFASMLSGATEESCMIHLCNGSWREISRKSRIKLFIYKYRSVLRIRRVKRG